MIADTDYRKKYEESLVVIASLQQELAQLKRMIYGSRHERYVPEQNPAQLALNIPSQPIAPAAVAQKIEYTRTHTQAAPIAHPGRMKLPEHLRREELILQPAEDITGCKKIGEEITEQLDYCPGELFVRKLIRPKYVKDQKVVIASLPAQPIDKGLAGAGLLAQIIIDKYHDHLPLHRQMQRFERSGVKLPYTTLTDWVSQAASLVEPLYEAHKKQVLASPYLHADETPIKVLDKDKKGQTHRGYFWVYHSSLDRTVLFDYRQGRGRDGPRELLKGFSGYLQTDGYAVYDDFDGKGGITLVHCMAHARRQFTESMDNDRPRSTYALEQIQKLYAIEREAKQQQLNPEQRKQLRQLKAIPILEELGKWLKENYLEVLPNSTIGLAIGYSLQRWEKLSIYTTDGRLNIDNNPVENSIRPVAIGRKNYLFCGSHQAAQRSAMLYSLLGTGKLHQLNPYTWLKDVLARIPDHPISKIHDLLPQHWQPQP